MIRVVSILALVAVGLLVVGWELQRYGARRLAYAVAAAAGLLVVVLWLADGSVIQGPWWILPALVLLTAVTVPDRFVSVTGGPQAEWGLVRSFELAAAHLAIARTEEEAAAGIDALRRLDRWRTPRTSEFVDLVQSTYQTPTESRPPDQVERLERLRRRLWAGLHPKPGWTEEVRLAWLRAEHGEAGWERADRQTRRGEVAQLLGLLAVAVAEGATILWPQALPDTVVRGVQALGVPAIQLVVGLSNGAPARYLVAWVGPLAALFLASEFLLPSPWREAGLLLGVAAFGWMAFAPNAWSTYARLVFRRG